MRYFILISFFISLSWEANSQKRLLELVTKPIADTTKKTPVLDPRSVIKPYETVITESFKSYRGLFTVHQYKDTVYFEIPESVLGRHMAVINRLVQGPGGSNVFSGEELGQRTIQFVKNSIDSSIQLRYITVAANADSADAISKAVTKSYAMPVAISFPIKAYGKEGSYVFDVSQYIKTANSLFNDVENPLMNKYMDAKQVRDMLVESIRAFPVNVEITLSKNGRTMGNFDVGIPAGWPATITTNTSFIALPEVPMKQRTFDPRVGYFADYEYNFRDNQQKVEQRNFILRWRLEPRDEDMQKWKRGELVEPQKPIIIYIDPATPKQWRPYLIAGINDWQKAFEQAGFKNAIQGKEWLEEGDSTVSMEDARYSFVRYLPSPITNAYGPQIHDPRSGEIIQTNIGWYHNIMKLLQEWYFIQASATDPAARKPVFDDKLMGELIRFVSSHEVGHTLGLRHNFGSSSQTPVDSLRSKTYLEQHGHTASIMDYARFNYVAQPEDKIPAKYLFPGIGEYDKWAIEWGYKYAGAIGFDEDKKIMRQLIVDRTSKNKRLWFGDGEEKKTDPRCQVEDIGDNPMKAGDYGIRNLQRILPNLPEWTYEEGGIYGNLDNMYKALKNQYSRYIGHVNKYIGGVMITPKSEDQPGEVIQPVSIAYHKEAINFFDKHLFTTPEWLFNPKVTSKVNEPAQPNFIEDLQVKALNSLMDYDKMGKILANQIQFKEQAYSVEQYLAALHKIIWRELPTGNVSDPYRRSLQKSYIANLQNVLLSNVPAMTETDIFTLCRSDMALLRSELHKTLAKATNEASKRHFSDLISRIDKTMDAKLSTE